MKNVKVIFQESQAQLSDLRFPYIPMIEQFQPSQIPNIYNHGFIAFGRHLKMARSVRVNLKYFVCNSENRRLLRKVEHMNPQVKLCQKEHDKQILQDHFIDSCIAFSEKRYVDDGSLTRERYLEICHNPLITHVLSLSCHGVRRGSVFICQFGDMMHYWHAFYDLNFNAQERIALGKYLMLRTILHAQDMGCAYIYLGAAYDQCDYYKINDWNALSWWDGNGWSEDIKCLKSLCRGQYQVFTGGFNL